MTLNRMQVSVCVFRLIKYTYFAKYDFLGIFRSFLMVPFPFFDYLTNFFFQNWKLLLGCIAMHSYKFCKFGRILKFSLEISFPGTITNTSNIFCYFLEEIRLKIGSVSSTLFSKHFLELSSRCAM